MFLHRPVGGPLEEAAMLSLRGEAAVAVRGGSGRLCCGRGLADGPCGPGRGERMISVGRASVAARPQEAGEPR
jgi:hypothetical protein